MTHPVPEPLATPAPPAPCRLFFSERLPAGPESESASEAESRVLLDLETNAPLAIDKLAYGWVRLASRELLYYAAPRDRLPAHDPFATAGEVLPDPQLIVLPEGVSRQDFDAAARDFYADLRPREVLLALRSRASADALLSRVGLPLKLVALVGVLLLLTAAGFAGVAAWKQHTLDDSAEDIRAAEARDVQLTSLSKLDGPGRSLFDALAVVNPHRPEGVSFSRVVLSDNRELVIEGRATGVSGVNSLADALRGTAFFDTVDLPKLDSSGGRSNFRLKVNFVKWPKILDVPTSVPGAEAAPAETKPAGESA